MIVRTPWFYIDVPGLGNVAISRHALSRARFFGMTDHLLAEIMEHGTDTPDGMDVVFREQSGFRLVVLLNPNPNRGAKLVKTIIRIQAQAEARRKGL